MFAIKCDHDVEQLAIIFTSNITVLQHGTHCAVIQDV